MIRHRYKTDNNLYAIYKLYNSICIVLLHMPLIEIKLCAWRSHSKNIQPSHETKQEKIVVCHVNYNISSNTAHKPFIKTEIKLQHCV